MQKAFKSSVTIVIGGCIERGTERYGGRGGRGNKRERERERDRQTETETETETERSFNLYSGCQGGCDYSTVQGFSTTCRSALTGTRPQCLSVPLHLYDMYIYRYLYALPPEIFDTRRILILRFVCKDRGEIYIGIYTCIDINMHSLQRSSIHTLSKFSDLFAKTKVKSI